MLRAPAQFSSRNTTQNKNTPLALEECALPVFDTVQNTSPGPGPHPFGGRQPKACLGRQGRSLLPMMSLGIRERLALFHHFLFSSSFMHLDSKVLDTTKADDIDAKSVQV